MYEDITKTWEMDKEIEIQWKQIMKDVHWTPDIGLNKDILTQALVNYCKYHTSIGYV